MSYPSPCEKCNSPLANCVRDCYAWRARYFVRQKQINAYARKVCRMPLNPAIGDKSRGQKFYYLHPAEYQDYLRQGPCLECGINHICDTPCAAYLQWWDQRMAWVRRNYG